MNIHIYMNKGNRLQILARRPAPLQVYTHVCVYIYINVYHVFIYTIVDEHTYLYIKMYVYMYF
jgi:hypothetical protein